MSGTTQSHEELLAGVDLFSGLSKRQLKKVLGVAREVHHPAGRAVATEGLGALAFHLIVDGRASVTAGGRSIRELSVGDYFGEISMIDGRPRSATVSTEEGMTTLAIPHQKFQSLLEADPDFARGLLQTLCSRLREAEARD